MDGDSLELVSGAEYARLCSDQRGVTYIAIPGEEAELAHHILFDGIIVGTRRIRPLVSRDGKGRRQFQIRIIVDTELLTSRTHFMGPDGMGPAHRFLEELHARLDTDRL
ncbi:hypothetical protein Poly30_03650 [Planctomycetes bacterium Poly30]|uniref:Uncharacterized protein n=2 Tax=Saltatorellus ferox TaxID=2528018 RepID=A0A518ELE2_9BACT|nr:hypothetical protein Poly30_03650 [Planctomycetes bacterium Poly30]